MENKRRVLWKLFVSTLYLSAFTFGGGYVIVSLLKKKFVDEYHWIENEEMLDLVAIAQSSPGAIAVNGAIVVGYKLAGMAGTVIAILGTIIPPFLIISAISVFYNLIKRQFHCESDAAGHAVRSRAVIASVTYEMGAGNCSWKEQDIYPYYGLCLCCILYLPGQCHFRGDCLRPSWRRADAPYRKGDCINDLS